MKAFYLTTAIDYVNSAPHLGHAYEKIISDVIVRWRRLRGLDVFFLTGTDENAQKVAQAAKEAGKDTKKFVDEMAGEFKELCKALSISYDDFIRTTEDRHVKAAQLIFKKMLGNGDIYKGHYEGLYCYGCEAFLLEREIENGRCKIHETELKRIKEESYFFRLSKYQKALEKYFADSKDFIVPVSRRGEMVNRLKEGLKDLSVSRYNIDWGIKVPGDEKHTVYVWKEALESYISALGYPNGARFKKFWPADFHVIGNEINWFHSVIWPAMLMSIGVKPFKHVLVHGMILDQRGEKMSKSKGNVIDPIEMVKKYGADALRYALIKEVPVGEDSRFSEAMIRQRINGELVSDLGNLVNRVLTIVEKFDGKIEGKPELDKSLNLKKIEKHMDSLHLHHTLDEVFGFVRACNKYINDKEPWRLKGKELGHVLYNLLEALRVIAILIEPFMPETSGRINGQLGLGCGGLKDVRFGRFKGRPKKGKLLFQKISS